MTYRLAGPRRTFAVLAVGCALASFAAIAVAESQTAAVGEEFTAGIERQIDALAESQLSEGAAPGITVAVVSSDRVLLAKGYGLADVGNGIAVDPQRSVFRIGSISKLFTATLVMQLVETGVIDLHSDASRYLDELRPQRPATRPFTVWHLLTHTAGFEELSTGTRARTLASARSLGDSLAEGIPAQPYPPGRLASYTNFALCLAGYVAESDAGAPFDDLVEERLLRPLGMDYTSSRQDLPRTMAAHRAIGYEIVDGKPQPRPFDILEPVPAGGFSSSAGDMARFMQLYLNAGRAGTGQLLRPETVATMQSTQFQNHPEMGSVGLTFMLRDRHGVKTVGHSGRTRWFRAALTLVPAHDIGIFVATNTSTGRPADIVDGFVNYLIGTADSTGSARTAAAGQRPPPQLEGGHYKATRFGHDGPLSLLGVLLGIELEADTGHGGIRWRGQSLLPGRHDTYRNGEGRAVLGFRTDTGAADLVVLTDRSLVSPYVPGAWYESPNAQLATLAGGGLLVLLPLLIRPVAKRRAHRAGAALQPPAGLFWPLCLSGVLALLAVAIVVLTGIDYYYFGPTAVTRIASLLPYAAAALLLPAGIRCMAASRQMTWRAGIQVTAMAGGSVLLIGWLVYWNFAAWL